MRIGVGIIDAFPASRLTDLMRRALLTADNLRHASSNSAMGIFFYSGHQLVARRSSRTACSTVK
jgi:hypothetical protein